MKSRLLVAIAAVAAFAVVVGGASPAVAGKQLKTKIEIKKLRVTGANGTVNSESNACVPNREVTLQSWDGFVSHKIGKTKTNSHGDWKVKKSLKGDVKYFAQVASKGKCGYDVSPFERIK